MKAAVRSWAWLKLEEHIRSAKGGNMIDDRRTADIKEWGKAWASVSDDYDN